MARRDDRACVAAVASPHSRWRFENRRERRRAWPRDARGSRLIKTLLSFFAPQPCRLCTLESPRRWRQASVRRVVRTARPHLEPTLTVLCVNRSTHLWIVLRETPYPLGQFVDRRDVSMVIGNQLLLLVHWQHRVPGHRGSPPRRDRCPTVSPMSPYLFVTHVPSPYRGAAELAHAAERAQREFVLCP